MRAVVRDAVNQRIGSASQYVQVPDTRKHQLALSGIVINLAPPELLAELGASPAIDKVGRTETWSQGGPALRRYRAGQSILYSFAVINPKLRGAAKDVQAGFQIRLFRDGKLLYTGTYSRTMLKSLTDPASLVGGGIVRLGGQVSPGEYLLQVVVTDELASKKKSQVAQWVDFEVVPGAG